MHIKLGGPWELIQHMNIILHMSYHTNTEWMTAHFIENVGIFKVSLENKIKEFWGIILKVGFFIQGTSNFKKLYYILTLYICHFFKLSKATASSRALVKPEIARCGWESVVWMSFFSLTTSVNICQGSEVLMLSVFGIPVKQNGYKVCLKTYNFFF